MKTNNNKLESKEIQNILKNQGEFDPLSFYAFFAHKKIVVPVPMKDFIESLEGVFTDADMKEEIKVLIYDYIRLYMMDEMFGREIDKAIDLHFDNIGKQEDK